MKIFRIATFISANQPPMVVFMRDVDLHENLARSGTLELMRHMIHEAPDDNFLLVEAFALPDATPLEQGMMMVEKLRPETRDAEHAEMASTYYWLLACAARTLPGGVIAQGAVPLDEDDVGYVLELVAAVLGQQGVDPVPTISVLTKTDKLCTWRQDGLHVEELT